MRIAIAGIRGIPVVYSGFESFAERLSTSLVRQGHEVVVYCRPSSTSYRKKTYKGVKLVRVPTTRGKNTETFFHSLLASFLSLFGERYDVFLYFGVGSSPLSLIPRIVGTKTVVNVDGLDWRREKWGLFGKLYLFTSEFLATVFPNAIVTDSHFIKNYYRKKFNKESFYIAYPFSPENILKKGTLKKFSLKKEGYIFWGGRLVPDNHLDELIKAYGKAGVKVPLVLTGDDVHKSKYSERLKRKKKNKNIKFLGFLDKGEYSTLLKNSLCYVETKRSGGTHPSLVEAMGYQKPIICNDHRANKEVLNGAAVYYKKGSVVSLAKALVKLTALKKEKRAELGKFAGKIAKEKYSWPKILESYLTLFERLT